MKKISFLSGLILFFLSLLTVSSPVYGQWFSRSQDSQRGETGARPFQVFGGRGFGENETKTDDPSDNRLFKGWGTGDRQQQTNQNSKNYDNGIFGGRGLSGIPFDDGSNYSDESNWNDFDASESQRWPFKRLGSFGNQSEMRSARRFEMDDRPRWFGNRPSLFDDQSDEPNWFERMNQRSKDFWSESSYRMQERNQAMKAKRQETWDSITRGLRPGGDRPEFDLPPFQNNPGANPRGGSSIDRF